MEMILFNEIGQGYINFESLEALTSVEFVELVKEEIEIVQNSVSSSSVKVSVRHSEYFVTVYVMNSRIVRILEFHFSTGAFTSSVLGRNDIDMILKIWGEWDNV